MTCNVTGNVYAVITLTETDAMNKIMTRAEYRKMLNEQDDGQSKHKNYRFQQRTRKYGDYLWNQDRAKFEVDYLEFIHHTNRGGTP